MAETEKITWNCEMEVSLFHALRGHKPVGVNRHFQMLFVMDKFSSSYKKVSTQQIWDYLGELYDLQALNESEIVPFPNKEADFLLPETDFSDMMQKAFPRFTQSKQDEHKSERDKTDKTSEKSDKNEKAESGSTKVKAESRQSLSAMATPDNSPKRKRTRNTPSTASPATPDAPPTKRRR